MGSWMFSVGSALLLPHVSTPGHPRLPALFSLHPHFPSWELSREMMSCRLTPTGLWTAPGRAQRLQLLSSLTDQDAIHSGEMDKWGCSLPFSLGHCADLSTLSKPWRLASFYLPFSSFWLQVKWAPLEGRWAEEVALTDHRDKITTQMQGHLWAGGHAGQHLLQKAMSPSIIAPSTNLCIFHYCPWNVVTGWNKLREVRKDAFWFTILC